MKRFDDLHVTGITPRGEKLLDETPLRTAMEQFVGAPESHKARVPGIRLLGAGKYSFTFAVEGVALKISSTTTSQESHDKRMPIPGENLEKQFEVLAELEEHLRDTDEGITTPNQFFVSHTPNKTYLLAQELKEGWVPLEQRTSEEYGHVDFLSPAAAKEIKAWTLDMRSRLERSLAGFALRSSINDLGLHHATGLHGGNILVAGDADLRNDPELAIIDQPGGRNQ